MKSSYDKQSFHKSCQVNLSFIGIHVKNWDEIKQNISSRREILELEVTQVPYQCFNLFIKKLHTASTYIIKHYTNVNFIRVKNKLEIFNDWDL